MYEAYKPYNDNNLWYIDNNRKRMGSIVVYENVDGIPAEDIAKAISELLNTWPDKKENPDYQSKIQVRIETLAQSIGGILGKINDLESRMNAFTTIKHE